MFSNNERLDITPEQEDLSTFKIFGILDLDKEFHGNPDAKVLNNETLVAKKFSKQFTDAIFSNCDEELGFVPRCQCGATKGTSKIGLRCKICDTVCSSQFIDHLQHVAWIAIPEVMPMVLHPIWYQILRDWTAIDRRNTAIIDIILNPKADVPDSVSKFVTGRGFQYFKDNYKEIISKLLNDCPKTKDKSENPWIERLLTVYGDRMFCRHIPILHSSLHPFKSGGDTLNFADGTPKDMLEAIIDISAETFKYHAISVNWKTANENLFKIYKKIIEYNTNLINLKLGKKEGLLRKHCYGSRIHFSLRAVVVPHDQILPMDEVVLPWGTMVNGLKLPILNFLMNRYHKPFVEAVEQWQTALTAYDPLIDKCISDYIAESPDGCIWVCIGRNPTLALGSIMLLRVVRFKKDPDDETLSINACIVKPANIDFDGDQLYGFFLFERVMTQALSVIHPSQLLFSTTTPGLADRILLLEQNYICIENFINDQDPDVIDLFEVVQQKKQGAV